MIYNIRSATIHDIDDINALVRESMLKLCKGYYTDAELESFLLDFPNKNHYHDILSDRILIVACLKDQIAGFTQYDPLRSAVDAIYVLPDHAGNGLGTRMLRYIEDIARSLRKEEILAGAPMNAIRFYEKSEYKFKRTYFQTCRDGTQFESAEVIKRLNSENITSVPA